MSCNERVAAAQENVTFTIPKIPNKRDNKTTQKGLWMLRVYDEYLQEMATFYGYPENVKEVVFCKYLRFFKVISV